MGSNYGVSLLILFPLLLLLILDSAALTASRSCPSHCGGIEISYPFGVGEGCYLEKAYEITCNTSISGKVVPMLPIISKEVVNISLPQTIRIKNPIASEGCYSEKEELQSLLNLTGTPFYFGNRRNTLIAVGCNNSASLTNVEPSSVGCTSRCGLAIAYHTPSKDFLELADCYANHGYGNDEYCSASASSNLNEKSCSGVGCCEANLPEMNQQIVGVRIDNTTTTGVCKNAFLTDEAYLLSDGSDPQILYSEGYSTVELTWFIHTENRSFVDSLACYSLKEYLNLTRSSSYGSGRAYEKGCACDYYYNSSTRAARAENWGARAKYKGQVLVTLTYASCKCTPGYRGNPYISGGCEDIDECLEKKDTKGDPIVCLGTCVNLRGGYMCDYSSLSKTHSRPVVAIGIGSSFGSLIFVGGVYWLYRFIRKQRKLNQKKKFFKRNGGLLLQQQLTSTDGNIEKTRVFSSSELKKATENFSLNRILGQGGQGTVYKGMLVDGRIVAVKKSKVVDEDKLEEFINEVVILSQINHRNIVKLLGCCLETDVPMLVYEFIPNGNLFEHLHDEFDDDNNMMATWEVRLRIAVDIAGALSYLHSSASFPIYHRDVKTTNIMLDEKYRAKVSDFGTSRSVTVDHTHLTTVVSGTVGYMDPEYFQSSQFTDKSDVYSFGVVLVELITGEKSVSFLRSQENKILATYFLLAMKENKLFDIIDTRIRDGCKLDQVTAAAQIARKCLNMKGKKRPSMREVSMELEKIRASSSVDMQAHDQYISENEEDTGKRVNVLEVESWNNVAVTAPASQYDIASSSLSSSDIEPLFPLQTR